MTPTVELADVLIVLRELQAEIREISQLLRRRSKPLLTVAEVAEWTGRAPFTVRRWIQEGRLKAERVRGTGPKGRLLIPSEQVLALIGSGRGEQLPAAAAPSELDGTGMRSPKP